MPKFFAYSDGDFNTFETQQAAYDWCVDELNVDNDGLWSDESLNICFGRITGATVVTRSIDLEGMTEEGMEEEGIHLINYDCTIYEERGIRPVITKPDVKSIYIAGPMSGYAGYNHKAFDEAAVFYESKGWYPINPVDLDLQFDGVDIRNLPADTDWSKVPDKMDRDEIIRRDVDAIMTADAIAMLPGWEESIGANAELKLAGWRGIQVRDFASDSAMVDAA